MEKTRTFVNVGGRSHLHVGLEQDQERVLSSPGRRNSIPADKARWPEWAVLPSQFSEPTVNILINLSKPIPK
jgi:hypothetical protein